MPDFVTPDQRTQDFRAFVEALVNFNWTKAESAAVALKYQLVAIREASTWFVVASDDSGSGRDPTVVINTSPTRDIILEAPHVPFEVGTGEEAVILLRDLDGDAALISGAHRCASKTLTACDGKTEVCGTSGGYRDSDAGHNTLALFHIAHLVLADHWNKAIVVSLHGMQDDNNGVHTSLIISDGSHPPDSDPTFAATKLRLAMDKVAPPGVVVSCNLSSDAQYGARPLCGSTNVQGRDVNGDSDACHDSVKQATGRFIHMEQDWRVLKPYAQNWSNIDQQPFANSLLEAFRAVVPASSQ